MTIGQLLPGLNRLAFTIPVSMTYLIPEIVTDVSAMLVDRMTFLLPWNRKQREHLQSGQIAMSNYRTNGSQNSRVCACLPAESSSSQMRTSQRQRIPVLPALPWEPAGRPWAAESEAATRTEGSLAWGRSCRASALRCHGTSSPEPRSPPGPSWRPRCHGTEGPPAQKQQQKPQKQQGHQEQSSVRSNIVRCRELFHIELKGKEGMKKHIPQ